jgi:hypothetical protein
LASSTVAAASSGGTWGDMGDPPAG